MSTLPGCTRTRSVSRFFSSFNSLSYSPTLIRHKVAMLNGREKLRKEYRAGSIVASGLGSHNRTHPENTFQLSKRGGNVGADASDAQQSMWMDTIQRGNSADKMGRIEVDRRIVVSDL